MKRINACHQNIRIKLQLTSLYLKAFRINGLLTQNKMLLSATVIMLTFISGVCSGCNANAAKSTPAIELFIEAAKVTASSYESKAHGGWGDFPPALTLDGDLSASSSWRAETTDKNAPQWIQYDLDTPRTITKLGIAFLKGDSRKYFFRIAVSDDAKQWHDVFDGESSGKTKEIEYFEILQPRTRYIRIIGTGNNSEKFPNWINITETQIWSY